MDTSFPLHSSFFSPSLPPHMPSVQGWQLSVLVVPWLLQIKDFNHSMMMILMVFANFFKNKNVKNVSFGGGVTN